MDHEARLSSLEKIVESAPAVGRGFWDFASEWPLLTATLGLCTIWSVERMWKAWCHARAVVWIAEKKLEQPTRSGIDEAEAEANREADALEE